MLAEASPATNMENRILVIEDEPGIVDFLERGLRPHGFEVISALDGDTGMEKALSEHVDLVVLDLMLPQRSGLEVLASLHRASPGLPVNGQNSLVLPVTFHPAKTGSFHGIYKLTWTDPFGKHSLSVPIAGTGVG